MNSYNISQEALVARCRVFLNRVKISPRNRGLSRYLRGPVRLVTARFNRRNAVFMVALCIPALLVTALFTLPGLLFTTPQHNEYFEFAKLLNQGGERWIAMGLSACCSFFCFAVPCEECPEDGSAMK